MKRLFDILTYKRPAGSESELEMIEKHIMPYSPRLLKDEKGGVLAYVIQVGDNPTGMFSAHCDTVHSVSGRQTLIHDADFGRLFVDKPKVEDLPGLLDNVVDLGGFKIKSKFTRQYSRDSVLGADDGAGLWLLLEMIDAGIPGKYFFHTMEEIGGQGSSGVARLHPNELKGLNKAVAFDRKGTSDIITTQRGGIRCCSDVFSAALAAALAVHGHTHSNAAGSFTDTANYTEIIAECTNVSVGYNEEHTNEEWLDLNYLAALREAVIKVDWEALPAVRDPKDKPDYGWDWDFNTLPRTRPNLRANPLASARLARKLTLEALEAECWVNPEAAAHLLYTIMHGKHTIK